MQDILENLSNALEPTKAAQPSSFSFPWHGMEVAASRHVDGQLVTGAIVKVQIGYLPFNQENPFSREQAILLATMYSGADGARFRISGEGKVSYEIHLKAESVNTIPDFSAEVATTLLHHLGAIREMTAFLYND